MRALSIAATGMLAQQLNVEVISNNIANMNTTAHKRQRAEFQDLLYQNIERVGANSSDDGTISPSGIQIGIGVKAGSVYRIGGQGDLVQTENPLDVAIQGKGLFHVLLPNGDDAYTRAGSFQLGPDGQIVTNDGFTVSPSITIPQEAKTVTVNSDGEVQISIDGQADAQTVGQLELATFFNNAGLEAIGGNLFLETAASGPANIGIAGTPGFGNLIAGFLETSNVNPVQEITSLITAQRAYEMNSRVIVTADEMMQAATNLR
ncbi:MAG: flagellar basal-body rod protein FlgG [Sphingomonadales bacterium]